MNYEATPIKNSKGLAKKSRIDELDKLGTASILWLVVKRHKFGLLFTYATILTVLYLFPFLPDVLANIIG